jgi:hypothetical protein
MFVNNLNKIWILGNLYKRIWDRQSGQVYCVDLFTRILTKFSLHVSEASTNFYEFLKFG